MLSPVRRLHDHQWPCGRIHKMPHPTQLDPLEVAHSQADQIGAVILPLARRSEPKLKLDLARIDYWLSKGAQQSDRVRTLVTSYRKQATA